MWNRFKNPRRARRGVVNLPSAPSRSSAFSYSSRARIAARAAVEALEERALMSVLPAGFTETLVATGLSSPTAMEFAPDGRVFITEQGGKVRVVKNGALLPDPFVTVNADSTGERGLLGVTVDPNFATNKYVYLYYTSASGESHNVVSRFTATGDTVNPASEVKLLELPPVGGGTWHMGGAMKFGGDGKLYVAVGDYQVPANASSLENPAGKILRINADGSIPTDNPFYAQTTGINRAIYALGLRNPFTLGFNPTTGMMFINEVGQSGYEEINLVSGGANYGWPGSEGPTSLPGYTTPFYSYTHAEGIAIIGGAFYSGVTQVFPAQYAGKYFFGDFGYGWLKTLDPATKQVSTFATDLQFPTGFATGSDGTLWYLSRGAPSGGLPNTGSVYKIAYDAFAPPKINTQPADRVAVVGESAQFQVIASGAGTLSYQWRRNGQTITGATSATYTRPNVTLADTGATFDCVVTNSFGNATTRAALLTVTTDTRPTATITSPVIGTTFAGGQTLSFGGTATDTEDGTLPASAFTWQIDYHTGAITRPFLLPTTGITGGTFEVPTESPYTEADVFFRVILTVKDSAGLTHTISRDVAPRTATVTLTTNIPGTKVEIDGQPKNAPYSTTGVVGLRRSIGVPLSQTVNGTVYQFTGWSDGGAATHSVFFPSANTTYTANYVARQSVYVSDLPYAGAPTNGWGPVEKDKSNGEFAAGDGRAIQLNGVTYAKGLGVHANSEITYDLGGQYDRFISDVGVDDEVGTGGSVIFQVWADGVKLFDSGLMAGPSDTKRVDVDVSNKLRLKLVCLTGGDDGTYDHASWADAKLLVPLSPPPPIPPLVYLSDLPIAQPAVNEWGPFERDRSNGENGPTDGRTLTLAGTTYAKGIGVHAGSELVFNLNGQYAYFQSDIGVDDEVGSNGSVVFQVWADGTKLYDSGTMGGSSATKSVDVPVTGVQQLRLVVTPGTDHVYNDHANWANARLTLTPGAPTPPPVTPPTLSIADASIAEGNSGTKDLIFTVTRSNPIGATRVNWATANGTATAGSDYTAGSGSLLFLEGESTKTVIVKVTGDTTTEPDEAFTVTLSGVQYGAIGRATATGTILNDETPPTFSVGDVTIVEGDTGTTSAVFTVTRTTSATAGSVAYATAAGTALAGVDFTSVAGTLNFAIGELSKTVSVPVIGDTDVEQDEAFTLDLSNPVGATIADGQGLASIVNDDLPGVWIDDVSIVEGNAGTSQLIFTLTRSSSAIASSVEYATRDITAQAGTDYTAVSGVTAFALGELSKTVAVTINGDVASEADETFALDLLSATDANIDTPFATGAIINDDLAAISVTDASVAEGDTGTRLLNWTVTRTSAAGPASVAWAATAGTATADEDFAPDSGLLQFADGELSRTISVIVAGDTDIEADETILLTLSEPTGATIAAGSATGTIVNDDFGTFSVTGGSLVEGNAGSTNLTFTITRTSGLTAASVNYTTANGTATAGSDYTATGGTANFAIGELSKTVLVPVIGDTVVENDETFSLTLSAPVNGKIAAGSATGTIANDDLPTIAISDAAVVEGNSGTASLVFTVTRSSPLGTSSVSYATANATATAGTDYAATNGTLTFAPGETSKTIAVLVNGDTLNEANETLLLNLSNAVGATIADAQGVGTLTNDDGASLSIADASTVEGKSGTKTLTFTITRSSGSGTASVAWATSNGTATAGSDYNAASGTVSFASGQTSKTISVTIRGDSTVEADETFFVTLSSPTNASIARAQVTGTIVNDDIPALTLQAESATFVGPTIGTQYAGYTGTGYLAFRTTPTSGDTVTWNANVSLGGTRTIQFRYANGGTTNRNLELRVNGTVVRASLAFAPTGGWNKWSMVSLTLTMPAGANTIRLASIGSSGPNLDSMTIS